MHGWPECPIGKTIVIFLTIKRCQVHKHVLDTPFVNYSRLGTRLGSYPATPAEPEPLIGLERLSQCNGQTSGSPFAGGVGNRYAVRNNDEARQNPRAPVPPQPWPTPS